MTAPEVAIDPGRATTTPGRGPVVSLAIGVVVVAVGRLWGQHVHWSDNRARIGAAPFLGRWDLEWRWWLLAPALGAALFIVVAPGLARSLPWRRLVLTTALAAVAWSFGLAATDGLDRVSAPLVNRFEYYRAVPDVEAVGVSSFIDTYLDRLVELPLHAKSHPPGMVLAYWVPAAIGLSGPGWAAALVLVVSGSGAAATLFSLRSLAGPAVARRAAPFLVLAPAAVWVASTADAFFAGVGAWVTAMFVLATEARRSAPVSASWAVAAGIGGGVLLHLSYGGVLGLLAPLGVIVYRRRFAVVAWASLGAAAVTAFFVVNGFWWFDGLDAARELYLKSSAQYRPYTYSLIGNLAALTLVIGPAAVAGLGALAARRRELPGVAVLVAGAVVAVIAANLSGMSKAETERIWLPFALPLLAAGAALPSRWVRPLLAASAVTALVLQAWLRTPW